MSNVVVFAALFLLGCFVIVRPDVFEKSLSKRRRYDPFSPFYVRNPRRAAQVYGGLMAAMALGGVIQSLSW